MRCGPAKRPYRLPPSASRSEVHLLFVWLLFPDASQASDVQGYFGLRAWGAASFFPSQMEATALEPPLGSEEGESTWLQMRTAPALHLVTDLAVAWRRKLWVRTLLDADPQTRKIARWLAEAGIERAGVTVERARHEGSLEVDGPGDPRLYLPDTSFTLDYTVVFPYVRLATHRLGPVWISYTHPAFVALYDPTFVSEDLLDPNYDYAYTSGYTQNPSHGAYDLNVRHDLIGVAVRSNVVDLTSDEYPYVVNWLSEGERGRIGFFVEVASMFGVSNTRGTEGFEDELSDWQEGREVKLVSSGGGLFLGMELNPLFVIDQPVSTNSRLVWTFGAMSRLSTGWNFSGWDYRKDVEWNPAAEGGPMVGRVQVPDLEAHLLVGPVVGLSLASR